MIDMNSRDFTPLWRRDFQSVLNDMVALTKQGKTAFICSQEMELVIDEVSEYRAEISKLRAMVREAADYIDHWSHSSHPDWLDAKAVQKWLEKAARV